MKTMLRIVVLVLASASVAAAQGNPDWHAAFPAFKIAGNLYYVGTADLAVYLIRTPQGNILITSPKTCPPCERRSSSLASNTATRRFC
jgi:metallo-beta-lactamase class B